MAEIFLSYDSEDRETAGAVAALLESAGWTVWWDRRIPAGRTWRSVIEGALTEMRCMVVLWSKHSVDSHWVKEEAEEARSLEKLVPVLIDLVKPPVGFRAIQAADLVGWNGLADSPGARQLIADLESLLGKPTNRPADAAPRDNGHASRAEAAEPLVAAAASQHPETEPAGEVTTTHSLRAAETANVVSPWLNWKTGSGIAAVLAILIAGSSLWSRKQNSEETAPQVKVETEAPPPLVAPALTALTVTASRNKLKTGESVELIVEGSYSDGTRNRLGKVDRWEISSETVVSIDDVGEIKALEPGTAKIVARYGNFTSDPWTVHVEAAPAIKPPRAIVAETRRRPVVEAPPPNAVAAPEPRAPLASAKPSEPTTPYVNPNRTAARENVGGYLNRAKSYRVQGNYTAAMTELERARSIDPSNNEVRQEIEQTKKACEAERRLGYSANC